MIGEMGIKLPGSQRRRISITRGILNDPRIVIFDEITAGLDKNHEKAIQQNMESLPKDRTAIVIAHQLSAIQNADLIVVLDKGKAVEQENHRALLASRGLSYDLVSQEALKYLEAIVLLASGHPELECIIDSAKRTIQKLRDQ